MKKKIDKTFVIGMIICLIPFVMSALMYSKLPPQVATHFDANNQPNGYSSRLFAAFGLPLIMLVLYGVTYLGMNCDPKRQNYSKRLKQLMVWLVPVLSNIMQISILLYACGTKLDMFVIVSAFMGVLFLIIGNYLPKCKHNYTMGIRLPWTLASEDNWNKTHHMAGFVWMFGGLVMLVGTLFHVTWILLPVLVVMVAVPAVYSFVLYKKENPNDLK